MFKIFTKKTSKISKKSKSKVVENVKSEPLVNKDIESHIWSLTPKILTDEEDIKKIQPYLDALNAGISNSSIKNIAVTGDYGSGKSTVLSTFQNSNPNYTYLNLSLASFKDEGKDLEAKLEEIDEGYSLDKEKKGSIELELEKLNRLIEVSILQQIIYQANPNQIPDSRFQRIIGISNKKMRWFAVGSIFWLISFFILFSFGGLQKANPENWTFAFKDLNLSVLFAVPIFFFGVGFLMFRLGRVLSNSKISKVNIKGEVELGKDLDKSILNKHLDEILYFFEQTGYNIVIIEDLDRFRNTQVFTKLREINLLLNKSSSIKEQGRKIVFVYAIRDEMFENSERVKFFDFIIPIIPFINPSNAKDQFYNLLKIENLESELKNEFIEDVVTYIDDIDMRLLINVFQEFSIYNKQIGSGILFENLFALILYKNIYPKDFTKLPRRKGKLYKFFNDKKNYLVQLTNEINEEISILKNNIEKIENESIRQIDELKDIYISAIKKKTDAIEVKIGAEWMLFKDLYEDENLYQIIDQKEFEYRYLPISANYRRYDFNRLSDKIQFSLIEEEVDIDSSFYERVQYIEARDSDSLNELKEQLHEKEKLKKEIESWSIKRIFQKIGISEFLGDFEHKLLIGNLLSNGYLDENYLDYVTIFHEAKLKISDKEFIKKVKSGQESSPDYFLTKPKEVIKEIPLRYFTRKEVLNYHILGYLLRFGDSFSERKDAMLNQIFNVGVGTNNELNMFNFIDGYIEFYQNSKENKKSRTTGSIPEFIKLLSSNTGLLWNSILSNNTIAQSQIDKYVKLVVQNSDPKELVKNKNISRLKDYFKSNCSVINLFDNKDFQKLSNIIQLMGIKFSELVSKNAKNESIYDFIYENEYYLISRGNIEEILKAYDSSEAKLDLNKLDTSNYTTIQKSTCTELKEYVDNNINDYLEKLFLKLPNNDDEEENIIIDLLNNNKINEEIKEKIILKEKNLIQDIGKVESKNVVIQLLRNRKLFVSWNNVVHYYKMTAKTIDSDLIEFLNLEYNYKRLSKIKIPNGIETITEQDLKDISVSLIKEKSLSFIAYSSLLNSIPSKYSAWKNIDFSELQEDKVLFLIENNFLTLTQENFELIDKNFENLKSDFLLKKQNYLKQELDKENLDLSDSDFDLVFYSNEVSDKTKEELIKDYSRGRITTDAKIASVTGKIASKYNRNYLSYSELHSIFKEGNNLIEEKLIMVNSHYTKLENPEIQELVSLISQSHKNIFNKHKRQKFKVTSQIILLAENLKRNKLIKSFHYEKNKSLIRFYPLT